MIHVLLLIPTLDQSGAEKQLTLLATQLPREEFAVQVVALTRSGPYAATLAAHDIPLTVVGKLWKFDPIAFWKLKRIVAEARPDILHTWLFAANAYGRLLPIRNGTPKVIVSERCVDTWKSGWQFWLDRRLIPKTTRLVGNSQSVAEFYRQQGFPAERITVIPNGIDVPASQPLERGLLERERVRAERLQIPPDARVIGYVGRLARQKRVKDLIWAFELIRSMREDAYLVIAGEGPERERLMQFAREIRAEERIRFLGHVQDVPELLAAFDVFWLGSDFEGLSNSVMEAMAAGLPVVASDIPPNRELIIPQETGFLVPIGETAAFAKVTERLLADSVLAQQMGTASQTRMREHFSTENMLRAYAQLYREVIAQPA